MLIAAAYSQSPVVVITGRVTNNSGTPLVAATLRQQGTAVTAITDSAGYFNLSATIGSTLTISHTGYATATYAVANNNKNIIITLAYAVTELATAQVVSTGYQTLPGERATGSFTMLNNEQLNRNISPNIVSRLEGMASGMAFNVSNYNGSTEVRVRGESTIYANREVLIVVDNFPYEGSIDNINPNDVESITVLKDAAAASIWGARAGNGVIVITTKSGNRNQRVKTGLTVNTTITGKPNAFYLPRMHATDVIDIEYMLFNNGAYNTALNNTTTFPYISPVVELLAAARSGSITQAAADAQINAYRLQDNRTNLMNYSYHNTIARQYALNFSGGSNNNSYYAGLGYDAYTGQLGNLSSRFTINLKNSFTLPGKLQLTFGVNGVMGNTASGTRATYTGSRIYERMLDDNGNAANVTYQYRKNFAETATQRGFLNWQYNPVNEAGLNSNTTITTDIRAFMAAQQPITSWLKAEVNYQYQQQVSENRDYMHPDSYTVRDLINRYSQLDANGNVLSRPIPTGGILDRSQGKTIAHNGRVQLNIFKTLGQHSIHAIAGVEARQTTAAAASYRLYGYDDAILISKTVNYETQYRTYPANSNSRIPGAPSSGSATLDRFTAFYTNISYGFNNKYLISASARKDASNYFGVATNLRAVPLWSAGLKWEIHKEAFYNLHWMPRLSTRLTYGYNGNINKNITAITTAQYIGVNTYNLPYASIANVPNPRLRWEKVQVLNLGIDFATLQNRLTGSIEFYLKNGIDLIGSGPVDGTTGQTDAGGTARFTGNIAGMKGRGWDVQINSHNLSGLLTWKTTLLFSYYNSKVTDYVLIPTLSTVLNEAAIAPLTGYPMQSIFSYAWAGLNPTGQPQGYLNKEVSIDYSKLVNVPVNELVFHGPARAPYFGSLLNSFSFKGFTLSGNLIYKFGHFFRRESINYGTLFSNLIGHTDYEKRWQQPGDEAITNVPAMVYPNVGSRDAFYTNSAALIEKAAHIRWQDVKLSYQFTNNKYRLLQGLQLYAYITNIGMVWQQSPINVFADHPAVTPAALSASLGLKANF